MSPLRTRPSFSFLKRKFPSLVAISVEVQGLVAPTSEEQAQAELYRLPEGFIYQWDWGLGVQKINKPILDAIRSRKGIKIVRLTRGAPTQVTESEYILNIDDYDAAHRGHGENHQGPSAGWTERTEDRRSQCAPRRQGPDGSTSGGAV